MVSYTTVHPKRQRRPAKFKKSRQLNNSVLQHTATTNSVVHVGQNLCEPKTTSLNSNGFVPQTRQLSIGTVEQPKEIDQYTWAKTTNPGSREEWLQTMMGIGGPRPQLTPIPPK